MPRLSLKPDSSFFRKIVVGAVGARAVRDDMAALGHNFVELERGSTDSKLWKDVKRKRVRIPDLVCLRCGQRIESRAKTRNELAMSHSEQALHSASLCAFSYSGKSRRYMGDGDTPNLCQKLRHVLIP